MCCMDSNPVMCCMDSNPAMCCLALSALWNKEHGTNFPDLLSLPFSVTTKPIPHGQCCQVLLTAQAVTWPTLYNSCICMCVLTLGKMRDPHYRLSSFKWIRIFTIWCLWWVGFYARGTFPVPMPHGFLLCGADLFSNYSGFLSTGLNALPSWNSSAKQISSFFKIQLCSGS